MQRSQALDREWISARGVEMGRNCRLVHQGRCSLEFMRKFATVARVAAKYYLLFHLLPLLSKLRHAKHGREALAMLLSRAYHYVKSVLFMSILVAVTKATLCLGASRMNRMTGQLLVGNAAVAPLGILLEEGSRQREIGYFVLAKAVRSIYLLVKRRGWQWSVSGEQELTHVVLMALFFYFYSHYPSMIKFRTAYSHLWGDA